VNKSLTAFANYSWQGDPKILDDPHPYPTEELNLPPTNRFNIGFNYDGTRMLAARRSTIQTGRSGPTC